MGGGGRGYSPRSNPLAPNVKLDSFFLRAGEFVVDDDADDEDEGFPC